MRRTTVGVFAVAALALAGCGVGQNAGVQKAGTSIDGVNVDLNNGQLQVRNAYVTPSPLGADQVSKGGTVQLYAHIFNNASQPDALVAVDCLDGGKAQFYPSVGTSGLVSGGATPNLPIALPAHGLVKIGYPPGPSVTISSLGVAKFVGEYIHLRLSFANAGSVTIYAPVEASPTTASAAAA
jgi:copper(I)-binding protein